MAFPIWLYCDDTSGNSSKRWNKHNSYLFTATALSPEYIHLEYNVHFLTTSNIAEPLELVEGIVEQIEYVYFIEQNISDFLHIEKGKQKAYGHGTALRKISS